MAITKDDLADNVKQIIKNDPVQDKAKATDILVSIYNCLEELQIQVAAGTTTIVQPLPDILKS